MAGYPPPYPPPGPPYAPGPGDWRYQRRMMRDHARAQRDLYRAQRDAYRQQYRGMRRGSIVGPLLVIAVGVVFLLVQTGKLSSNRLWSFYGHWWPLLLIFVGVVILIEWGFDQFFRTDKPYVARGIGGGVVALLIGLAVVGVVFQGIHNGGQTLFGQGININGEDVDQFLGDKHESEQTLVQAFPGEGTLQVNNPRGDVTISGTSDDNQIHVLLHKEIYSRSDSDAAEKAQQLSSNLNVNGSLVQLNLPAIQGARVDLIITVPSVSTNTVIANHGDIHVSGLKGPVNITANHGDIEVSAITGAVTAHIQNSGSSFSAHSVTGAVQVEGKGGDTTIADVSGTVSMQGDFFGDTHLEHIRGGFKFHSSRTDFQLARLDGEASFSDDDLSADQVLGPVVLTTRNRNITLDRVSGDVAVTNKNGKVDVTSAPPLGNVTVENRNGGVSLTVPEQAGFNVHAETSDADITNDFSLPVSDSDNRKSLSGSVGHGSSNIKLTTTKEDIALKRASIAPLPPLPPPPPVLTDVPAAASRAAIEAKKTAKEAQKVAHDAAKDPGKAP